MNKVHKKRLLKLADFIEGVKPKMFDIGYIAQKLDCGTVCCAIGYLPQVFPRHFKYGVDDYLHEDVIFISLKKRPDIWDDAAAADFFGLTSNEIEYLFMPQQYQYRNVRPKTVAKRIRRVVEGLYATQG